MWGHTLCSRWDITENIDFIVNKFRNWKPVEYSKENETDSIAGQAGRYWWQSQEGQQRRKLKVSYIIFRDSRYQLSPCIKGHLDDCDLLHFIVEFIVLCLPHRPRQKLTIKKVLFLFETITIYFTHQQEFPFLCTDPCNTRKRRVWAKTAWGRMSFLQHGGCVMVWSAANLPREQQLSCQLRCLH